MKTKHGDFIEVDFVAKTKDDNKIFDLTLEKVARENNISDEEIEKMESEIDKELEEAIKFAKQSSFPKKELLNEYLFSK